MSDEGAADEFFDASFVDELEELADSEVGARAGAVAQGPLQGRFLVFLAPLPGHAELLTEEQFTHLPPSELAQRTNALIEACREAGATVAVQKVENFIVFFQALMPTLTEGSASVQRVFYRLAPTLLHIAHHDFGESEEARRDGAQALRGLETILLEISSVRLAPTESELVFRSIDQMSGLIAVGEYALAESFISSHLLSLIRRNKLTRALYRIMEVEVSVQNYLREKLGYRTPQIRLPEDIPALADYGPVRILEETDLDGERRHFLQVQIPDVPILREIVLRLVHTETGATHDLRADALGSAELDVPAGTYGLGLVYEPEGAA